jgi:hypothetical protein
MASKYPAFVLGTELKVSYFSLAIQVIHVFGSTQDEMHQIIILEVPLFRIIFFHYTKCGRKHRMNLCKNRCEAFLPLSFVSFFFQKLLEISCYSSSSWRSCLPTMLCDRSDVPRWVMLPVSKYSCMK